MIAYNPEFLRQGSAIHDTLYPDRIVLGSDSAEALGILQALYRSIVDQTFEAPEFLPRAKGLHGVPLVTTDLASAEIIKYAANAFLALKISFANELAQLTERVNADISQVIQGVGMDKRIGHQFLQAGLGWGGSCFGKDTSALVAIGQQHGVQMQIVCAAREVNYAQRQRVVAKLRRELGTLEGKVVGLLGLAFKPHTDDLRDSPALDIARQLVAHGAVVRAHDPEAFERARQQLPNLGVELCQSVDLLAEDADALILATEWPQYQALEWEALASVMHNPLMLDGRNALDRKALEAAGFQYVGMGQPDRPFGRPQVTSVQPARGNLLAAGRRVAGQLRSFDRLFSERVPAPA
jgi:UDPglucose 6-dehydrogenase